MSEDEEKKVTHRIEVHREPEIDELHKELAEKEALLEQAGMQKLEEEKSKLKEKYYEYREEIEGITTPSELDKFKLRVFNNQAKEKPRKQIPSGKAPLYAPKGENEYSSQTEMVDKLYDMAYYNPRKYSSEEVEDAKQKIDTLLRSMLSGQSWKQLKERGTSAIEQHKISACPKCHFTKIDTDICPNCSYNPKEKQAVRD
jgi:ribosomal protein L32